MKTYISFIFHAQINIDCKKCIIVVILIFSHFAPMPVPEILKTQLSMFWTGYAAGNIVGPLCQQIWPLCIKLPTNCLCLFDHFVGLALKVSIKSYFWVSNLKLFTFLKTISTQHNRVNKLKCHRPRDILINVIGLKGIGVAFFSLSGSFRAAPVCSN